MLILGVAVFCLRQHVITKCTDILPLSKHFLCSFKLYRNMLCLLQFYQMPQQKHDQHLPAFHAILLSSFHLTSTWIVCCMRFFFFKAAPHLQVTISTLVSALVILTQRQFFLVEDISQRMETFLLVTTGMRRGTIGILLLWPRMLLNNLQYKHSLHKKEQSSPECQHRDFFLSHVTFPRVIMGK